MSGAPVLGVDPGTVRIGLAASDPTGAVAGPVATLSLRAGAVVWRRLAEEIERRQVERVVVGLPRRLDGGEGEAAAVARDLAGEIGRRTGLPVELWDEWFTTAEAERTLIGAGMRRRRRRVTVDAVAATLMLQGWLDRRSAAGRVGG